MNYRVYYAALHHIFDLTQSQLWSLYRSWGRDIGRFWDRFDTGVICAFKKSETHATVLEKKERFSILSFERYISQQKIQILFSDDPQYPKQLQEIYAKVYILYAVGNISLLAQPSIALVGSRKISVYGKQVIRESVPLLVSSGFCIVSGGAVGVDTMVHEITLKSGGHTIAVLGTGIDVAYPRSNTALFRAIVEGKGLLLSECSITAEPRRYHFPMRNRIIGGISQASVIVEAGEKSGALITAKYALEIGSDVYAVVGNMFEANRRGVHALVQRGEAFPIVSPPHLLESLGVHHAKMQKAGVPDLSDEEHHLLSLCTYVAQDEDTLLLQSGYDIQRFMSVITLLEIKKCVERVDGGSWVRICRYF